MPPELRATSVSLRRANRSHIRRLKKTRHTPPAAGRCPKTPRPAPTQRPAVQCGSTVFDQSPPRILRARPPRISARWYQRIRRRAAGGEGFDGAGRRAWAVDAAGKAGACGPSPKTSVGTCFRVRTLALDLLHRLTRNSGSGVSTPAGAWCDLVGAGSARISMAATVSRSSAAVSFTHCSTGLGVRDATTFPRFSRIWMSRRSPRLGRRSDVTNHETNGGCIINSMVVHIHKLCTENHLQQY